MIAFWYFVMHTLRSTDYDMWAGRCQSAKDTGIFGEWAQDRARKCASDPISRCVIEGLSDVEKQTLMEEP